MAGIGSNRSIVLGAGVVGLVCGSVLAVVLAGSSSPRAEVTADRTPQPGSHGASAPQAAADAVGAADAAHAQRDPAAAAEAQALARSAAAAALLPALSEAHAGLHATSDATALAAAVDAALKTQLGKDADRRKLLTRLYAEVGAGRFARGGRLTALGGAVVARVRELDRHGLDPKPYRVDALEAAVADVGVEAAAAPAGSAAGRPAQVLQELLAASALDATHATERLLELPALPTREDIAAAADALRVGGLGAAARPEDVALDVQIAAALVQLALDQRFVRKAGPFDLRKADTVLAKPKEAAALLALLEAAVEAPDAGLALAGIDPPHPQYAAMVEIYARYRGYAESGACKPLPGGWRLRAGMKGAEVTRLQERLACEGYLDAPIDGVFEGATVEAVKTYQRHHELAPEGNALGDTLKSMNVPIERRVAQLAIALQRLRESSVAEMGDPFIRVNVPAFELSFYEGGKVIRRQRVIVGTNRLDDDKQQLIQGHINRTQLFTTRVYEVIVNPTWILPQRVEHGELKGKLEKDPDYLTKNNIKQVTLGDGKKVLVQGLGDGNVLGKVKFLLEKTNAIYLHDTDKRHLFKETRRDFSHGCIRVQEAIDFGKWLLARDGVSEEEINRAFRTDAVQRGFDLKRPVDLLTEYVTVDLSDEGLPVFLTDVYQYDQAYLDDTLPPRVSTRWGASKLRPRWVPEVSSATVDKWRAEGTPAPRDYDPKIHGE